MVIRLIDSLQLIYEKYSLKITPDMIYNIEGYPHIKKVLIGNDCKVIKELNMDEKRLNMLEIIYKNISSNGFGNTPMLTQDGMYICKTSYGGLMVFEELQPVVEMPTAKWWADTLFRIHNMSLLEQCKDLIIDDYFSNENQLFTETIERMPSDIKSKMLNMLDMIHIKEKQRVKFIINHGDPLESNIMKKMENLC